MQPQAPANPLGTAPIKSLIWKYAIPGIITQLVSALHNIVDQVFVGWGIGDNGIAATARRVVRLSDGKIISDKEQEVDWE